MMEWLRKVAKRPGLPRPDPNWKHTQSSQYHPLITIETTIHCPHCDHEITYLTQKTKAYNDN